MLALRRAVVGVALAGALVGAACSSGGSNVVKENPQAALSVASKRTAEGDTVKIKFAAKAGGISVATGTGAYDFKEQTGRFKLSGALLSSFDLILTPDKVYVRTPSGPKKWAGLTQAELETSGSGGFLASIRSQIDPREMLRNLGQTTKNVKVVGEEKVRGVATTHVHGDVDLSDAAIAKAPADAQDSLRQARARLATDSYPLDVWLDNDGRVHKLAYDLTVQQGTDAASTATTSVLLELYDFGKDPHIVIPKPADVKEGLN